MYFCGELAGGTPPVAKVMRKEARHTQRQDRASGVPLEILEHLILIILKSYATLPDEVNDAPASGARHEIRSVLPFAK